MQTRIHIHITYIHKKKLAKIFYFAQEQDKSDRLASNQRPAGRQKLAATQRCQTVRDWRIVQLIKCQTAIALGSGRESERESGMPVIYKWQLALHN